MSHPTVPTVEATAEMEAGMAAAEMAEAMAEEAREVEVTAAVTAAVVMAVVMVATSLDQVEHRPHHSVHRPRLHKVAAGRHAGASARCNPVCCDVTEADTSS